MAHKALMRAGLVLGAAIWACAAAPQDLGGAARVTDGDTLHLGAVTVRLFGIDAPEARQTCTGADGGPWACGRAAADRLSELLAGGPVRCRPRDRDRYGRLVSVCTAGGVDLGGRLVAEGLARAYTQFSDAYATVEADARAARRGLWQGAAEAPWAYRADNKLETIANTPRQPGCDIKGNISSGGERIYHLQGDPAYARTRIDPRRGEAWFCDTAQAEAAGFRPPARR